MLILLLGIAVLQFKSSQVSLRRVFDRDLAAAKPLFDQIGWNASDSGLIHSTEDALNAKGTTLNRGRGVPDRLRRAAVGRGRRAVAAQALG